MLPPSLAWPAVLLLAVLIFSTSSVPAAELNGERIFQTKCAACHGAHGEGTKKHKDPLAGDKSASQLLDLIAKTMPDDDPGTLSKRDAEVGGEIRV